VKNIIELLIERAEIKEIECTNKGAKYDYESSAKEGR